MAGFIINEFQMESERVTVEKATSFYEKDSFVVFVNASQDQLFAIRAGDVFTITAKEG